MKFQVALATILLPLAAMAAPTAENDIRLVQAIPVVKAESETQSAPHSTGLEELSKRSNISCKIVNTSSAYVNCRSGPGFQYSILAYVLPGGTYTFHCYQSGSCYQNNCTWDQVSIQGGGVCYVNGYYTSSACSAAALGKC